MTQLGLSKRGARGGWRSVMTSVAVLAAAGCGAAAAPVARPPATAQAAPAPIASASAPAAPAPPGDSGACAPEPVHFAYDSSTLDDRARTQLQGDARCANGAHSAKVEVTGMTDPRGTDEYNLALGDRRAREVSKYLGSLGVDKARLSPRSVGKEYATGTDEGGWAQDRRAEVALQ